MTAFDLAVVGAPFFDLTFARMPHVPRVGEEIVAGELRVAPGGTGMQAVASARLGVSTALVAPIGSDPAAEVLRSMLEAEGVAWIGRRAGETPTTAILTAPDGSAMATALGAEEPSAEEVAGAGARAVVLSLGRLPLRPPGAAVYATTGSIELDAGVRPDAASLDGVRCLILNASEAGRIADVDDPTEAARRLADGVECVVVTLGADGALAVEAGREVRAAAPAVEAVDPTGAGDLFVAAYVWADRAGLEVDARIAWATLYASLSVRASTALDGALRLEELLAEGEGRGLPLP